MTGPAVPGRPAVPDDFVAIGPPLAGGGSAVVWRARHRISGREVALKVWNRPLTTAADRDRFDAESRIHRQLSGHPRIVAWLWASAPPDGSPWMATELHGVALSELVATGDLPDPRRGVALAIDLLDGLAAVHAQGVVHRDVTPANVLVDGGRAALCDLGIAMHIDTLSGDPAAGTTSYLAPEVRRGATPDFRSDVWSAARTIRAAVGDDVPDALDAVLTRAESEDPGDRPVDAADFRDRLRAVAAAPGVQLLSGPEPAGRAAWRRRWPWIAAAVVLAVAVTAMALALGSTGDGPEPVLAALQAPPDVDGAGRPVTLGPRDGGECAGARITDGRSELMLDGQVVAVTTVYFDAGRQEVCGLLTKDAAQRFYKRSSYLALTLCNPDGSCDSDWFEYPREAGPVRVSSADGCVSWRASVWDPDTASWLIRDQVGSAGC